MLGPINWINRNTASTAPPILISGIIHEVGAAEGHADERRARSASWGVGGDGGVLSVGGV